MHEDELLQGHLTELRRGTLALAVFSCLSQPQYGYSLLQHLEERHIRIEANTLYPLLRRLETQGLLTSDWDTAESRPRKYYCLSERGRALYAQLKAEWRKMSHEMNRLLGENDNASIN